MAAVPTTAAAAAAAAARISSAVMARACTSRPIKAVCFDKDGTLVDTAAGLREWANGMAEKVLASRTSSEPAADSDRNVQTKQTLFTRIGFDGSTNKADPNGMLATAPWSRLHTTVATLVVDHSGGGNYLASCTCGGVSLPVPSPATDPPSAFLRSLLARLPPRTGLSIRFDRLLLLALQSFRPLRPPRSPPTGPTSFCTTASGFPTRPRCATSRASSSASTRWGSR